LRPINNHKNSKYCTTFLLYELYSMVYESSFSIVLCLCQVIRYLYAHEKLNSAEKDTNIFADVMFRRQPFHWQDYFTDRSFHRQSFHRQLISPTASHFTSNDFEHIWPLGNFFLGKSFIILEFYEVVYWAFDRFENVLNRKRIKDIQVVQVGWNLFYR